MPRFGVSIYSISRKIMKGEITPEQGVRWLAEQGAEVIEIVPFGIDFESDPELIDRLLKTAEEVGIPIDNYSINANFLQINEDEYLSEINRVKRQIDYASKLNVSTMRVDCAGFRRSIESNTIENFQLEFKSIVDTYRTLCDYAAQYKLVILLENHGFHVNGSERVRQILTQMDRSNFGHQLDVGNYICVDDMPEIAVKKVMPFAKTVHCKDFYVRPSDKDPGDATQFDCSGSWFRSTSGRFLRGSIFGQGDLDVYDILKTVKQAGFDGNIYIEYEGMEDCYYGTKVSLDNLKRIYSLV